MLDPVPFHRVYARETNLAWSSGTFCSWKGKFWKWSRKIKISRVPNTYRMGRDVSSVLWELEASFLPSWIAQQEKTENSTWKRCFSPRFKDVVVPNTTTIFYSPVIIKHLLDHYTPLDKSINRSMSESRPRFLSWSTFLLMTCWCITLYLYPSYIGIFSVPWMYN